VIGKELQIRRALSRSHLYSSAFVVEAERGSSSGYPKRFKLIGGGWGHGVGLCQIGAAVMAELGHSHEGILAHYFNRPSLRKLY
jgi:SpoIID/LytB domain protein